MKLIITILMILLSSCGQEGPSSGSSKGGSSNGPSKNLPQNGYITHLGQTSLSGATGDDWANSSVLDSNQNLYIAGVTKSNLNGTAAGNFDAMVMKLDKNGKLAWKTQYDSSKGFTTGGEDYFKAITLYDNYLYVTGYTRSNFLETRSGVDDIIFSKLDLNGNIIWTKQFGNTDFPSKVALSDQCWAIDNDGIGGIYLGCSTASNFADTNPDSTKWDVLIIKVDTDGDVIWAKQFGSNAVAASSELNSVLLSDFLHKMVVKNNNEIYIGGYTNSELKETNAGGSDGFIAKLNGSGAILWVRHLGQTTLGAGKGLANDSISGLDVGSDGKIYFAGETSGQIGDNAFGGDDFYFGLLNADGTVGTLVQPAENTTDSTYAVTMKLDSKNNLYIIGDTQGSLFDIVSGYTDGFIAKYSVDGTLIWSKQFSDNYSGIDSSSTFGEYLYVVEVDKFDNVYAAGGTAGNFKELANNLNTTSDLLLIKLTKDGKDQ